MISTRVPMENSDTVSSIVSLLVRFPEISSLWSHPTDGTLLLTYVVGRRLTKPEQRDLAAMLDDHVRAFVALEGRDVRMINVRCETDQKVTFVHCTRDSASFTREELLLQIGMLGERFGDALVKNPVEDPPDEEMAALEDEEVEHAIDAMRDPAQKRSLVGYRDEKRVMVYFVKHRKAKASARR
ncbi:MAG: hypothetical protein ACRENA_01935 [Vulcanimicrobiaceae bacterium]